MPLPRIQSKDWSRIRAAHLMVRAGFGATPAELNRLESRDPEDLVQELVNYDGANTRADSPAWYLAADADLRQPGGLTPAAFRRLSEEEQRKLRMEQNRQTRERTREIRGWWLERMQHARSPLEEKLTLFWHGHFATSIQKVRDVYPMFKQHLMLRAYGIADWASLLEQVSKDPAMLVYLDNARSNKRQANENYARELMELFVLGEGHYSEQDVGEAARAFTGWSLSHQRWVFEERKAQHDADLKTFLGHRGTFDGRDIIRLLVHHPESAGFLVRKLWSFFAFPDPPEDLWKPLADRFRETDFALRPLLVDMFLHPAFYGERALRTQIKGPVFWLVHLLRMLEIPTAPGVALSPICAALGQDLFAPPSVKGWDGGASWINASTLATRHEHGTRLVEQGTVGREPRRRRPQPVIARDLLSSSRLTRREAREELFDRFFHHPLREVDREQFDDWLKTLPPPLDWTPEQGSHVLLRILKTPQFQLT